MIKLLVTWECPKCGKEHEDDFLFFTEIVCCESFAWIDVLDVDYLLSL